MRKMSKKEKKALMNKICSVCGQKLSSKVHIILNDIYFCLVDNQYHFPEDEKTRKPKKKMGKA